MNGRGIDWQARAIQVAFVAGLILLWYLVGAFGKINAIFLPELPRVIEKFLQIIQTTRLYDNLRVTMTELAIAYAIACTLGRMLVASALTFS